MAHIAEPRYGLRGHRLHIAGLYVEDDLVPYWPVNLLPLRILRVEPPPFGLGHARLRPPPHCRPPEPHAEVQGMVPDIQAVDELAPVPGLFEPIVLKRPNKLADDPFVHKFLIRLLPMIKRRVIIHRRTGEDREYPSRQPEHLVHDPLGAHWIMLHQYLQGRR